MASSSAAAGRGRPLGLYVHFPFCVAHCTYCDFFTKPYGGREPVDRFVSAVAIEMAVTAEAFHLRGCRTDTLYLGGGTPSLLEACDLDRILSAAAAIFHLDPDIEISLEANPESVSREKLAAFRDLGVNRLSLGVQSFQPAILALLGRAHGPQAARGAVAAARGAGFSNLSLDLMLALPGQTPGNLARDLEEVVALEPDHISAYLLEMDKESALRARIERGEVRPPGEEEAAALYEETCRRLAGAGYTQYEVSSFACPGRECRHNLKYWTDCPFVGFGPSAWSYLDGRRWRVTRDLEGYLESARRRVPPGREEDFRTVKERLGEAIFAGLRLRTGVDVAALGRAYGVTDPLDGRRESLADLESAGLVRVEGSRLRLTEKGLPLANEVFQVFV